MAYFSPEEAFETLKDRTAQTVKDYFPLKGEKHTLVATKVEVDDDKSVDDIRAQQEARLKNRSWTVPVKATFELRDNSTNKVIDKKTVTVAQLPKITRRYTNIVDGNEWQVNNQFRLKSGVYTRRKDNGELTSQWNLAKGRGFSMDFDPEKRQMKMAYGASNVPVYPILKTLGVADDDIERQLGREIMAANMKVDHEATIRKMYKAITGKSTDNLEEAKNAIREEFSKTELRPDSTKLTLGQPFKQVDGTALLAGASKLLKVSRGEEGQDDRDSLEFKELWSAEDLIAERLGKDARRDVVRKLTNNVDRKESVGEIVSPDILGKPLKQFFTSSTLAERPDQRNPIGFLVGARKTTTLGQHGIDSERKITLDAQSINPSHLGFLDPVTTPESGKIGSVLQLSSTAVKKGKDVMIPVIDAKTGRMKMVTPGEALRNPLAFPDQYEMKNGKPVPVSKEVKIADEKGDFSVTESKNVKYILPSSKAMFDISTNLIPFLQNDQGNRTMVASRQLEQAVSVKNREPPLVQTKGEKSSTFEDLVGRLSSHEANVDGKVVAVGKDAIKIKDQKGKTHEVMLYDDFPLNDNKSLINSNPIVKVGDVVKKGQTVADTSFTKNGSLALGTNLRVAYMPYRGYNFEDGVVISETAAKKLASEHLHRQSTKVESNVILNKKKFLAQTAGQVTKDQADKLDDDGIIKPGTTVLPGDVLIGELRKEELTPEQKQMALFSRKASSPIRARPSTWEKDYPGVVSKVVKHGKDVTVFVKTENPTEMGDKIVGRHGNKGIVSRVIPDNEMPRTVDGKPMEVLLNPAGVPSRINLGQVLETAAAKIAEKTGKPYIVNNFDPKNKNYTANLLKELEENGISDTEDLIDPKTGKKFKQVLTGPQYMLKLHHMADKDIIARSRDAYTANLTPRSGGKHSGQTMDAAGLYALLGHGARHNVQEAQSIKSELNDDLWTKLQSGEAIPAPQVPFVYKKFESMLKGAGVDVKKEGNELILQPLTDKGTLALSNGEIKDPGRMLKAKDAQPEKDGLFDPVVTGTPGIHKMGAKWSHITLGQRMPNPVFEKPIKALVGLTDKEFDSVMAGKKEINGKTSAEAIVKALDEIDPKKELKDIEAKIPDLRGSALNKANQRAKYLRALQKADLSPKEAYTQKYIPVLPPNMRPISVMDNGDINEADLNGIYSKGIGANNDQLKSLVKDKAIPREELHPLTESLYDSMKALTLTGMTYKGRYRSGIVEQISGAETGGPKTGFFQDKVIGRRQDMSMRGTIVPEPSLNLDQVGLPKKAAAEMYKPFVVARMRRMGFTPLEAQKAIKENNPVAEKALEAEVAERPVLLKRDPVLHKYGVMAFKPVLTKEKVIKIHPLVTSGFNADFDGDHMSAYVPVSPKAVQEASKMFPSNNLFSSSTSEVMYKPGHEAMLGLYKLSEMGKKKNAVFNTPADAARAVKDGKIDLTDVIKIKNIKGNFSLDKLASPAKPVSTTVGRVLLAQALPASMREEAMTNPDFIMTKGKIKETLTRVGKENPSEFAETADKVKDLGNEYATGVSISLKDFLAVTEDRDSALAAAEAKAKIIRSSKNRTKEEKDKELLGLYSKVDEDIQKKSKGKIDKSGNRMYEWVKSGARGDWDNYRQMAIGPMIVVDSKSKPVPVPITKSYGEGLDIGGYWTAMHGARMGTIGRVQGTELPGALFKEIVNTSMNQMVSDDDCGTTKGVSFNVDDKNALDRFTATDINLGVRGKKDKGVIPAGTEVTPRVLTRLKNNGVKAITVRSPIKCQHGEGVCAKCMGLNQDGHTFEKGTNVGILAAQALGEPTTQLAMNSFHTGGVAGAAGSTAVDKFERLQNLMHLPQTLKGAATLSHEEGKVEKVEKDPAGGWGVVINGKRHFVSSQKEPLVKPGQVVRKGDALSSGVKNPREMLPLTGLSSVQGYLADEIEGIYGNKSPLHRRNTEVIVRSLTNLTEVQDPGSNPEFMRGDRVPASVVNAYNSKLKPGEKPVKHTPILKGTNIMPVEMQTDWLARMQATRLKDTLLEGAAKGWRSNVHSTHPVPGMAVGKEFGLGTKEAPWLY